MINHNGKEYKKECLYVYNRHFAIQQRLAQHFKSTILKLKKVKKKKTKPNHFGLENTVFNSIIWVLPKERLLSSSIIHNTLNM